ncbi:hypothetical protein T190115A13A_180037 [Tenacibaculum sp. 190524A02b]|uniref:Uncharacterized protein n=1 Tax=Tenacibaculum vairaonense TaxID=3137860 RepID=A0ABM9PJ95_9FLAO
MSFCGEITKKAEKTDVMSKKNVHLCLIVKVVNVKRSFQKLNKPFFLEFILLTKLEIVGDSYFERLLSTHSFLCVKIKDNIFSNNFIHSSYCVCFFS